MSLFIKEKSHDLSVDRKFHIMVVISTMQIFLLCSKPLPILASLVVAVRQMYRVSSTSSFGGLSPSLRCSGFFSPVVPAQTATSSKF
jgi:hypothetical protein